MDGGAWWAAVHGVAMSQTRLRNFTFTFHFMHWRRKWQPTPVFLPGESQGWGDRKSTRLNSSHHSNSYAVFCLKKKTPLPLPLHFLCQRAQAKSSAARPKQA